jgi:hypothetical protein
MDFVTRDEQWVNEVGRFRRAGRFLGKWLWVPNLVFVGGALLYCGCQFGAAVLEWIEAGGIQ